MSRVLVRVGAEYLTFSPDEWTRLSASDRKTYEVVIQELADADAAALFAAELRKVCSDQPPDDQAAAPVEWTRDG
jgi:hypothetical protein